MEKGKAIRKNQRKNKNKNKKGQEEEKKKKKRKKRKVLKMTHGQPWVMVFFGFCFFISCWLFIIFFSFL
jgi:quinol-cytochrome oxidoreductase complex cytochrome b subunit